MTTVAPSFGARRLYGTIALAIAVGALVMFGHVAMMRLGDAWGPSVPLVLRALATATAIFAGLLMVVSYVGRRNDAFLTVGVTMLGVAAIEATRTIVLVMSQNVADSTPLLQAAGRLGWAAGTSLPLLLLLGMVLLSPVQANRAPAFARPATFIVLAAAIVALGVTAPLLPAFPGGIVAGGAVARPAVSWAVSIYLVTLVLLWRRPDVSGTVDGRWLVFALYVGFLDQTLAAPFWSGFGTGAGTIDASLKLTIYALVGIGVLVRMMATAREQAVAVARFQREAEERARTEEALARQAARLSLANEELEEYAYLASHDLQEPLRMVTNYLQLIERRYGDRLDEDGHQFMRFAVDGAVRMKSLIQDLLAYSTLSAEDEDEAPADASAAFDAAVQNLEVAIEEAGAEVTRDELPTVGIDSVQLTQLFQNLVGNALKFRRADVPPRIHAEVERSGGSWRFALRDNGIGIDPKYRDRVFKVFQRLHRRESFPGSGIGLAMCRKIVTRHGGEIWFESRLGEGTTFYWTVPTHSGPRRRDRSRPARHEEGHLGRRVDDMIDRARELV